MNREDALMIARRQLDRIEQDGALHLDAMADEIMAGSALLPQQPKWFGIDWGAECKPKADPEDGFQRLRGLKSPPSPTRGKRIRSAWVVRLGWTDKQMRDAGYFFSWSDGSWGSIR